MIAFLLRCVVLCLFIAPAFGQTYVKHVSDCTKRRDLCTGTDPLMLEVDAKTSPEAKIRQDLLVCRPLPLTMQRDCILDVARAYFVEETPGVYVFLAPTPSPNVEEQLDAAARAKDAERERKAAVAQEEAAAHAERIVAEVASRERARQERETMLRARPPEEVEARRREAAQLGEHLQLIAMSQLRTMLVDPESARITNTRIIMDKDRTTVLAVCGTVSGTNRMGARVSGPWLFSTESDHVYIQGFEGWSGSGLSLWSQHCS